MWGVSLVRISKSAEPALEPVHSCTELCILVFRVMRTVVEGDWGYEVPVTQAPGFISASAVIGVR
jgi:hypothetical protein